VHFTDKYPTNNLAKFIQEFYEHNKVLFLKHYGFARMYVMAGWKRVRAYRLRGRHKKFASDFGSVDKSRLYLKLAKFGFFGAIGGLLILLLAIPLFAFNLPSPDKVIRREGFSSKILDRNGNSLYDIFIDEKRTPVDLDDLPQYLKDATISIEDQNFYNHQGFDIFGMVRGLSRAFTRGRAQGGSTLTQQLVKNVLLTSERSVFRKIKEFILAVQIERKYEKDEILQMYLNEAPYGGTAWGVGAAAETYFGKSVKDLNLVESAILAGMPQRPSVYSPYSSTPDAYIARTEQVLRRMKEDGKISEEVEKEAVSQLKDFPFQEKGSSFKAPHFVQYVEKLLIERYGESVLETGGLRVTTSLDLALQEEAQKIVAEEIEKVSESAKIGNGAAVVINPQTGEILAMVGSKDFNAEDYDGQYNVATALRQPGSSIKPFTYVTAFKKGYTPATVLMDVPTEFPGGEGQPPYKPVNYDGKFRGPIQIRYALANSVNIPAVKMLAIVGIKDVLETAYDMGITTLEPNKNTLDRVGLSLTLGGGEVRLLEITSAYSPFMNTGFRVEPTAILKVEDGSGKALEEVHPEKGRRVLTPEQAFLIFDILSDNAARTPVFGPNSLLNVPGQKVAVKTGTTNERKDNWTIGGNPEIVVGVWVGNNDNSSMTNVASGVTGASPIWRKVLVKALEGKSGAAIEQPGGIVTAAVDAVSGYAAHDGYPSRDEKFVDGTQPGVDTVHLKLKVCKNDGKLATPSDIAGGNYDEKEFFVFKEEDPTAKSGGENLWQKGILEWIATQNDSRYNPPTDYCGTANPLNVEFVNPKDKQSNLANNFTMEVKALSTSNIKEVEFYVDGTRIVTLTGQPYKQDIHLENGVHKLRAKAYDDKGNSSDREITIGVNTAWDYAPTNSPTPSPSPVPSPTPTLVITL
jgi:1A family penicillin-binding protein